MRRRSAAVLLFLGLAGIASCDGDGDDGSSSDPCKQPDQDGIIGGDYTFEVTVNETGFTPTILKAQNSGAITLTVRNTGTKTHSFSIECLTVQGCTSCFPAASKVDQLAAGAQKTVKFTAPEQEGIFTIKSEVEGDTFTAQFILQ
jgi:hypothetical protein